MTVVPFLNDADVEAFKKLRAHLKGQGVQRRRQLVHQWFLKQASPNPARQLEVKPSPLVVATLNMQYYSSYPEDREAGAQKLREALGGNAPPDVVCVQEGLACTDVLEDLGFDLAVCAGAGGVAQSVRDMVYSDEAALKLCPNESHEKLLCNQIYIRGGSGWAVCDQGVEKISSAMRLCGCGSRVQGELAVRSMVWVKMQKIGVEEGSAAFVMCTHLSGGRFEDQYFLQKLAEERRRQTECCMTFFAERPDARADDVGILVGDFNATEMYAPKGPMHGYFKFGIAGAEGVLLDAENEGVEGEEAIEESFKDYMTSPFKALRSSGWMLAYGDEVGVTSAFGHLIDHMALSRSVPVKSAEVLYLTNQKVGGKAPDTEVIVTDHNAVKVAFEI